MKRLNTVYVYASSKYHRAGRETGQGTAGQGGDDVRAADWEDQVGVRRR